MKETLGLRLADLKAELVGCVPCSPNERAELARESLSNVVVRYMTWVDRLIPPRPRKVIFADGFWRRSLPNDILEPISRIARMAEAGEDLNGYLSPYVRTHGYISGKDRNRHGPLWADGGRGDKDFALNTMEVHHLHLKPMDTKGRRRGGSRDLLFADVSRATIQFICAGDHNSFKDDELRDAIAKVRHDRGLIVGGIGPPRTPPTSDRHRLSRAGMNLLEYVDNRAVFMGLVSGSGFATGHVMHADRILTFLNAWDSRLDTDEGRAAFRIEGELPERFLEGFRWAFWYGDFCIVNQMGEAASLIHWRR